MKLYVVKAAQTHSDGSLLLGQTDFLKQLRNSLEERFELDHVRHVEILSGTSARERTTAQYLASLLPGQGSITYSHGVTAEAVGKKYLLTMGQIDHYLHSHHDTVILVCVGNLADQVVAAYGRTVLQVQGLDDDRIVPASCRMLDCKTCQVELVF